MSWLVPDAVFDRGVLRHDLALRVEDGHVAALAPAGEAAGGGEARRIGGIVTPGFVDLQVNGGGDCLLNEDATPGAMARILAAHRRYGTVAILPTVITDAPEVMARAAEAAIAAKGTPGLAGLHIEGPHIAAARRGTHAERFVRPLDEGTLALVRRLRDARVAVLITLAPEMVTPAQVAELAATGAVVSIGHSNATAEEARAVLDAGARCFTHLFNAMSPMQSRAPGVVGAAINSEAHVGIICDGIHVADEMVALAIRARPVPDRMFLVSDAMPTVGGSGRFSLYGHDVRLAGGRLVNAEGSLAGAHVTMGESVARLVGVLGVTLETALRMGVSTPAEVIGQPELARIEGRPLGDLLELGPDGRLTGSLGGPGKNGGSPTSPSMTD